MNKNIKLPLLAAITISLSTNIGCWSLNPFKWVKSENTQEYHQELIEHITTLETNYAELVQLVSSCEIDLQSEDLLKQLEAFQNKLIEFIQQTCKPESVVVRTKKDMDRLYLEYPCISYRKKLSDDITTLDKTIKRYMKHVKENIQDKNLLEKAHNLLINLAVFDELIIRSEGFANECEAYSDKCSWHNNRLTDVTALTRNTQNPKVTASIS